MVDVFITVDTEVWPQATEWPHVPLSPQVRCEREIDCYFWGGEGSPKLGLPFQLETLNAHDLRATFFVDPLFSFALGLEPLRKVVATLKAAGQEIGLHLHPEWLTDPRMPQLPAFAGPNIGDYPEEAQAQLIKVGLARLAEAGAESICAFRAGSWGANAATLRAAARNGIRFDSSLNACYATSLPDLPDREAFLEPRAIEGLWEFPLTHFLDRPPHGRRPLQVCACSLSEIRYVLEEAHARQWSHVTMVTHSFEFVRTDRLGRDGAAVGPRRLLGARFEALCEYLGRHRDRFRTTLFRDIVPADLPEARGRAPIPSNTGRTVARWASQAVSLVY